MNKRFLAVAYVALLTLAMPVVAHHSTAHYNFPTPAEINGTVKMLNVSNPHMKLVLLVKDGKGEREIVFEGHSLNHYYRAGWRKGLINVGDQITVSYAPRKDGADGGFVTAMKQPNGEWIRVGGPPPPGAG